MPGARIHLSRRGRLITIGSVSLAVLTGGALALVPGSSPAAAARAAAAAGAISQTRQTAAMPSSGAVAAANTLVVDANQNTRPVTHVASGALYGLADDLTPSDEYVTPLHPNTFVQMADGGHQLPNGELQPAGDALAVADKAARDGAKIIVRAPDWYSNFPYQWVSWSNWSSAIDSMVRAIKVSGDKSIEAIALWNEPNNTWPAASGVSFNEGWVKTYDEVRSLDPGIPVDGPSLSYFDASYMQSFLEYAKANNALPDIISWHELGGQSSIAADVAAMRSMEASLGISPRPIVIEEYGETTEVGVPGSLAGYIAKFERAGVASAELAFWNDYGTMGDLLTGTGGLPNGAWWLYKWYGDMSGEMVNTVPPAQTGIDGAASVNAGQNQVSVVFGGGTGSSQVTVNGVSDLAGFKNSQSVHVVLQDVESAGRTTAVEGPETIFDGDLPVTDGTVTVPVAAMNASYGYHVIVTPAGKDAPGLDGTYRIGSGGGQALTISEPAADAGAHASVTSPGDAHNQLWDLVSTGTGYYEVINDADGLLLGSDPDSATSVVQVRYDGDNGELWQLRGGGGHYVLVNKATGLALNTGRNGAVSLASGAQPWTLTPAALIKAGQIYTIANLNSEINLEPEAGAITAGTLVDQAEPDNAAGQEWKFIPDGTGYYNVENVGSGLLLGIQDASTAEGANADIEAADGAADQEWQLVPSGVGTCELANAGSGLLLGVSGENTSPGALTLQWADNGTPDHQWWIAPAS
ncbi:MAG: RICIN domain-containing protein [Trebonia sp.]